VYNRYVRRPQHKTRKARRKALAYFVRNKRHVGHVWTLRGVFDFSSLSFLSVLHAPPLSLPLSSLFLSLFCHFHHASPSTTPFHFSIWPFIHRFHLIHFSSLHSLFQFHVWDYCFLMAETTKYIANSELGLIPLLQLNNCVSLSVLASLFHYDQACVPFFNLHFLSFIFFCMHACIPLIVLIFIVHATFMRYFCFTIPDEMDAIFSFNLRVCTLYLDWITDNNWEVCSM